MPTIREAQRRDTGAIVALWREMMETHQSVDPRFHFAPNAAREFERHVAGLLRERKARILVAEAEGRIIGYILGELHERKPTYPVGKYGFISDISVTEQWRRRGVGRALAENLFAWFRARGVTAVELFAADSNPASLAFWKAMGFRDYLRLLRHDTE